jgi:hypothetical protein
VVAEVDKMAVLEVLVEWLFILIILLLPEAILLQ